VSTLAELYEQYGPRLYRYALVILADVPAAEDALQEAFCQLAEAIRRRPGVATLPYLNTIVRNECYSRLRTRRRTAAPPIGHPLSTRERVEEAMLEPVSTEASGEELLLVENALRRLPTEQREAVYLKVYEGLTFREIGERCGVSMNTAASRYRYALDALRNILAPSGSHE
jgi:RNA polymerase sigma-70 factor (ECF subfamily)